MPFQIDVQRGGKRFKAERTRREWTQAQAAARVSELTGVPVVPQEISRLEKGQTENPSMASLLAVGATYGMSPDQVAEEYGYVLGGRSKRPTELQLLNLDKLSPKARAKAVEYVQRMADEVVNLLAI
jgi:transcriptional regulator with XRE-family HTH domain